MDAGSSLSPFVTSVSFEVSAMRLEPRQCDFSDADQRKPQPVSLAVIRFMPSPFKPVGRCIYCGIPENLSGPEGLNDEHIIPFSLGGTAILPKASCSNCSNETHAFEGYFAGVMFEAARTHFYWKSRKRKRPTTLPVANPKGGSMRIQVEHHPPVVFLNRFLTVC